MAVSKDAVKWAFRLFLGRDISDNDNLEKLFENFCKFKDEHALADAFVKCEEFRIKNRSCNHIKFLEPNDLRRVNMEGFDPQSNLKISLFGNCHVSGIGKIIEASYPGSQSIPLHLGAGDNNKRLIDQKYTDQIKKSDFVIVQCKNTYDLISSSYPESIDRIRIIPNIPFNGFHPDNDYIKSNKNLFINGVLGQYNSLLAAWCWNHDMSVKSTLEAFREEVFDHLGYFSCMQFSRKNLIKIGYACDYPMPEFLMKWFSRGCFMHSLNHPKIFVLEDIANEFLRKEGIKCNSGIDSYLHDELGDSVCWPVYPEIGNKYGIRGNYNFKKGGADPAFIDLEEFILTSFNTYDEFEKGSLCSPRFQEDGFQSLDKLLKAKKINIKKIITENPYSKLPSFCFWKRAISTIEFNIIDPVVTKTSCIGNNEKVATAGSCFAQHIAKRLAAEGFNYYVSESGDGLTEKESSEQNYGVFSCRYGNLYTTRQLVQLFDRSIGRFTPKEKVWQRADGRYVDPFRPHIDPAGFDSLEAVEKSRIEHLACVKEMFEKLDILVFTLGLTESWESLEDGSIYPLAPGVAGGMMDPSIHRFRNFTAKEVADDLELFLLKLQSVNPKARVILTVSPVPLIATYENRHVLVSNTHSKAVLRTVAGEMASRYEHCDYFPSYEIITGPHVGNGYLEDDLRSVRSEGVDHVMRVFLKHYAGKEGVEHQESQREIEHKAAIERINDVICDEEAIAS